MLDRIAYFHLKTSRQKLDLRGHFLLSVCRWPKANITIEKESGKSTVRTKYRNLVKQLKKGDTLYIENVDRLSRDYDGILREWHILTQVSHLKTPDKGKKHKGKRGMKRLTAC